MRKIEGSGKLWEDICVRVVIPDGERMLAGVARSGTTVPSGTWILCGGAFPALRCRSVPGYVQSPLRGC
jgi:hypothetical protein